MIAHHLSFGSQVQATVVGLLAAVAAVILGAISKGSVELSQAAVLCASSVTTAFIAALSLGELFWFLRSNMQHSGAEKTVPSSWEAQVTSLWSDTGRRDAGSVSPMSAAFTPSSSCLCFFSPRICCLLGSWHPQQQSKCPTSPDLRKMPHAMHGCTHMCTHFLHVSWVTR